MKTFTVSLLLLVVLLAINADGNNRVRRVNVFMKMIACSTGRSPYFDYNGYGCWCGAGGSGTPLDATDQCCKDRELCYKALVNAGTCNDGDWILGASYQRDGTCTGCSSSNTGCAEKLCYCDQQAANCFRYASFNRGYKNYNGRC